MVAYDNFGIAGQDASLPFTVDDSRPLRPEERLMLAVLTDAIECYQDNLHAHSPHARRLYQRAKRWLFEPDARYTFSFETICESFGRDPKALRRRLTRWRLAPAAPDAATSLARSRRSAAAGRRRVIIGPRDATAVAR
jgi:hypothetical protein